MASRWTPPEVDYLDQLTGNVPVNAVLRAYNSWARRHGYSSRTATAIAQKASSLGLSLMPTGDWIGSTAIAEAIHVSRFTVRRWITSNRLPASRDGVRYAVRRRDLRQFAREHQRLFSRATRGELVQLLEDEVLADEISGRRQQYSAANQLVRCVETGTVYPSLAAAARAHFVVRQVIQRAIRTGQRAGGRHWERIEGCRYGTDAIRFRDHTPPR